MPKPHLVQLTNTDPAFYPTLGPYLARHDVHIALGGIPWDDPTKTWLVLHDPAGVIGFAAINEHKTSTWLESLFIDRTDIPRARETLVAAAAERFGHDRDLRTKIRTEAVPAYAGNGFAIIAEKGHFTTLVRPATIRKTTR